MFGSKDKTKGPSEGYADPNADCPLWGAPCKKHGCRFWFQIMGTNPNTGASVSEFNCAIAWLPMLIIENTQQARQAGASSDKVANEVDKFRAQMARQNNALGRVVSGAPLEIERSLAEDEDEDEENGRP